MAVRSALPWPFRWAVLAIVFGFCAAIGLWAFELGKDIAGLERGTKEELVQLRAQLVAMRGELATMQAARDKAQSIANTAGTELTSEKAAQERLQALNKQLEGENRALRDDLGFFERLIPSSGVQGMSIRGLQAEVANGRELRWQVLVIQAVKNAPEFKGRLELTFNGVQNGKPWTGGPPTGAQPITLRQYGRMEGVFELPPQTIVKALSARVMDGTVTKAAHTIKL
jgi:hypothetical protein